LCIRLRSFSTNTFLFFMICHTDIAAMGTYDIQNNMATAMNGFSSTNLYDFYCLITDAF
jgi:hypothetical protein